MPYVPPATVVTGTPIASTWGNAVKAAADYLANPPACRAQRTTSQAIANITPTAVAFDSESFDTDSMHSTVTNTSRLTFNTAGLYIITASVMWESNATGTRDVWLQISGSTRISEAAQQANAADLTSHALSAIYKATAAQYVELIAYQSSGASRNVIASITQPHLAATWIGLG